MGFHQRNWAPAAHVAIEFGVLKHPRCIAQTLHVPTRNIPVEYGLHVGHLGHVPIGNTAVEFAVLEQPHHAGDVGNIDVVQIAVGAVIGNFGLNKDL